MKTNMSRRGAKRNGTKREVHGMTGTPIYLSWKSMRQRCENPNCTAYAEYGGRGIRICERWNNFSAFLEDMGECPVGMSLDRINPYGHYEPGNCRWASRKEQAQNKRESVASLARTCDLNPDTVIHRLHRGMNIVDALMTPLNQRRSMRPTLREVGRALGVTGVRIGQRINIEHSLTWEEAIEIVNQNRAGVAAKNEADSAHGKD